MAGESESVSEAAVDTESVDIANSVLGKIRLILEAFDIDDVELSLSELARRTGVSKASVHRLNQELLDWGMLERAGDKYRLGLRAFELGSRVPRTRLLREALGPYLESLHFASRETVHLAVRDGTDVLYLDKVNGIRQTTKPSRVAGRMPLHCTATGKVLLAYGRSDIFREIVERGLTRQTPKTIVAPKVLADQIRRIREQGYATEQEETTAGYGSVAVPIFGTSGIVVAAMSLTVPTFRINVARHLADLQAVRKQIESAGVLN